MDYSIYYAILDWYSGSIALGFLTGMIISVLDTIVNGRKNRGL